MRKGLQAIAALALILPGAAATQQGPAPSPPAFQPPRHSAPSPLMTAASRGEVMARADAGTQIERDRAPAAELDEHRKLDRALRALAPQRPGVVDAYVVSIALDSDAVFGREARVAGDVLRRRYGALGRTIVLAGSDGGAPSALPRGSPGTLAIALARIAELMDKSEDVLVLYTTSHGAPFGLYYNDGDNGYGAISPNRMAAMLDQLGLGNRLLILSACYSGVFVPRLQSETSAIVTAASFDRSSFGCLAENDWTFFGDAMINHALRKAQPLGAAFAEANGLVAGWEAQFQVPASRPQFFLGASVGRWLDPLERRTPRAATQPVGRPALESSRASMLRR
jgi:Peptidase C13 family